MPNDPGIILVTGHDQNHAHLARVSGPNQLAYCVRNGYHFHAERFDNFRGRHPSWARVPLLKKYLPHYAWSFWCDADVVIMDGGQKLEHFLEDWAGGSDLVIPRDSRPEKDCFCNGTCFWKNTPWALDFLDRVWAQEDCTRHRYHEQEAMQHLFNTDPDVRRRVRLVPRHWFGAPYNEYQEGDFLIHFSVERGRQRMAEFASRARV